MAELPIAHRKEIYKMARKKFYSDERKESKFNGWNVGKYIRLSRFDNDNAESYSVINQRKLINDFIEEHEEFISSEEFIDDDWTGTNFNRPGFQRMMDEIRSGNEYYGKDKKSYS